MKSYNGTLHYFDSKKEATDVVLKSDYQFDIRTVSKIQNTGDITLTSSGDVTITAGTDIDLTSSGTVSITAVSDIDISNTVGDVTITAGTDLFVYSSGITKVQTDDSISILNTTSSESTLDTNALLDWSDIEVPREQSYIAPVWSPDLGLFSAVSYNGTSSKAIITSPDSITWTSRTAANDIWSYGSWAPGLGLFIYTTPTAGTNDLMTSSDGITWTTQTTPATTLKGLCWSDELSLLVIAGNSNMITSTNGTTFTTRTNPTAKTFNDVCWSPALGLFCACTHNSGAAYTQNFITSRDGITWESQTNPSTTVQYTHMCWSPQLSLFVAVGYSGIITSPDGETWTTQTCPALQYTGICWASKLNVLIACSNLYLSNKLVKSADGITWTEIDTSATLDVSLLDGVCYSPELNKVVGTYFTGGTSNLILTNDFGLLTGDLTLGSKYTPNTYLRGNNVEIGEYANNVDIGQSSTTINVGSIGTTLTMNGYRYDKCGFTAHKKATQTISSSTTAVAVTFKPNTDSSHPFRTWGYLPPSLATTGISTINRNGVYFISGSVCTENSSKAVSTTLYIQIDGTDNYGYVADRLTTSSSGHGASTSCTIYLTAGQTVRIMTSQSSGSDTDYFSSTRVGTFTVFLLSDI